MQIGDYPSIYLVTFWKPKKLILPFFKFLFFTFNDWKPPKYKFILKFCQEENGGWWWSCMPKSSKAQMFHHHYVCTFLFLNYIHAIIVEGGQASFAFLVLPIKLQDFTFGFVVMCHLRLFILLLFFQLVM